jgi:hypothetical protein
MGPNPRAAVVLALLLGAACTAQPVEIPLPEHPRPDRAREDWQNLNGAWAFRFDPDGIGLEEEWQRSGDDFERSIAVPFPWGSPLSGVPDSADVGWYARAITVPAEWRGRRVFVVVGASDWRTSAWLDGERLGEHQGGYTPFEFEISSLVRAGETQDLVFRVDDTPHDFKLEGKQGYGPARGIWQTVYLEARGTHPLRDVHVTPDPGLESARATLRLDAAADIPLEYAVSFPNGEFGPVTGVIAPGTSEVAVELDMPGARRWSLDDPYLHDLEVRVGAEGADVVRTYFGMRTISTVNLPGTDIPYVALNGRPVYLQLALDQAYHPEGYYAFPTDEAIRGDVERALSIGLNGIRVHVKIGLPRKLYWADRLGLLVMADVPNSWGEPDADMRRETEYALREMMRRDFNHPSIFSWVVFNETWGLRTTVEEGGESHHRYLQETKDWVAGLVREVRAADPTRLVEDNSVCCGDGHTVTDLNSWHAYLPGWEWSSLLEEVSDGTYAGSTWNYEDGYAHQGHEPNLNSEFGNVWGYEGSTGDVDWSWDYHRALNAFRRHPRVAGWLYTEHHDVINEWNGYWRFDRSGKETGLGELVPGMSLRDLHGALYVSVGEPADLARDARSGVMVGVGLWVSHYGDTAVEGGRLEWALHGWDHLGRELTGEEGSRTIAVPAWHQGPLDSLRVTLPEGPAVAVLRIVVRDAGGEVLHRNFQTFVVDGAPPDGAGRERYLRRAAADFERAEWSDGAWDVLGGLKVNGAGHGFIEYRFPWPADVGAKRVAEARFVVEASAKQRFDKDRPDPSSMDDDYMRGGGTLSPHRNPNAYPMTDETAYPTSVSVEVNGLRAATAALADDPADHRGILSWHAQLRDRRLREAGSYGYLVEAAIPPDALRRAVETGELVVRLSVAEALPGGLAVYGRSFGRYPLDPTVVLTLVE